MNQALSLIGEKLGSFRIESVVGSGAMGVVYRATNEKSGRIAAVKVVSTEFAQGGKIRDRFEREAEILQQFRHPNIVRFLAVGRFRGTSYLAMEFVEGETLEKSILDRGSLPWLEVVELGIQICDWLLQYAHQHGVVHRDLKPSNLMITADGKIKLTDFGIAKDLDATALTGTGRTLGTAAYMAPEQIRGSPAVSHKTDLYALGVVLYQLLVGKPPFEGGTPVVLMHSHLNEPAPRPSARLHEIPKVLDELIVTLMAKLPADRPWDAAVAGMKLTELRDKASRGASIAMVWPSFQPGGKSTPASAKARFAAAATSAISEENTSASIKKKTRKSGGTSRATRDRTVVDGQSRWLDRSKLETAGLIAILIAIGGFIVYRVWPPGELYLYRHAEKLMASSSPSDWKRARDEYITELDDRFPNHPHQQQIREWRDKILLEAAESRGGVISSGLDIIITKPKNDTERKFLVVHQIAKKACELGDELAAGREWQRMADEFKEAGKPRKGSDPEERQWYLLASRRVQELENRIKDRRELVVQRLAVARAALRAGRPTEAVTIQSQLVEELGKYTDVADLLRPAANLTGPETKETLPAATAPPSGEPDLAYPPKPAAEAKQSKERSRSPAEGEPPSPESPPDPAPKDAAPES